MKIQEILYNELSNDESVKEQMIEITENNHTQKVKKQRVAILQHAYIYIGFSLGRSCQRS